MNDAVKYSNRPVTGAHPISVSSPKTDCLRVNYEDAFKDWVLQVNRLHAVVESSQNGPVVNEAEEQAAAAEVSYRESRDRLTDEMIAPSGEPCRRREEHDSVRTTVIPVVD